MTSKFEREFLHLAKWYLACRLEVMGGEVEGMRGGDLAFSMLGMHDHAWEMELMIAEVRCAQLN